MTAPLVDSTLSPLSRTPEAATVGSGSAARVLSPEQVAIVTACDSHLLIDAGAGSGKTSILIDKILFEQGYEVIPGVRPLDVLRIDQIGAITFTRKAAGEILDRLRSELLRRAEEAEGADRERWAEQAFRVDQAAIGTIDSFAGQLLRDFGGIANFESGFTVLDEGDAMAIYTEVAEAAILDAVAAGDRGATTLVAQFGYQRSRDIVVGFFREAPLLEEILRKMREGRLSWAATATFHPTLADVVLEPYARAILSFAGQARARLVERMTKDGLMDHNQVILRAGELLAHPDVQDAVRARFKVLFIDEHQDTNLAQCRLFFRMAGIVNNGTQDRAPVDPSAVIEGGPTKPRLRLVLIGDPKQGIYSFRQADITMWNRTWREIQKHGGQYCALSANHRSRPALNAFFDDCLGRVLNARDYAESAEYEVSYRPLTPRRPVTEGPAVEVLVTEGRGNHAIADTVAERIRTMLASPADYPVWERGEDGVERARPVRARDIAILSRQLSSSAEQYERALRERGISAYVYGGRGLFARQEIRDIASLLSAVADPHDPFSLTAFLRSPLGGVDDVALTAIAQASVAAAPEPGAVRRSLYDALRHPERYLTDADQLARVERAARLIDMLRSLSDRLPHDQLIEMAMRESGYRAFLAGAPDAPAGARNVDKLVRLARTYGDEPLFQFVTRLSARIRRADHEDEAPIYAADDDLITICTIHRAKGLEWPYVFVSEIGHPVVRKGRGDAPALDASAGLALPLDILVKTGAAEAPLAATSRVWDRYVAQSFHKEYAEGKRLFYVACTRARDRLFFVGNIHIPKYGKPTKVAQGPQDKWVDGVERWLRICYPALAKPTAAGFQFGPKGAQHAAHIRRGLAGMRAPAPVAGAPTGETVVAQRTPQQWPAMPRRTLPVLQATVGDTAYPVDVAERMGDMRTRALVKTAFTASELLKYYACEHKHEFGFRYSISTSSLVASLDDEVINRIGPEVRGDILHDFLSNLNPAWTAAERLEHMRRVVLRHIQLDAARLEDNAVEILRHVDNFLGSREWARIGAATRVWRESPFVYQFPTAGVPFQIEGVTDLVFEEPDGIVVLDFKAALFRGMDNPREVIKQRAASYTIQAAAYAIALEDLFDKPVKQFIFYFTDEGVAESITVDAAFLATWRPTIERIVAAIRQGEYGPAVWEQKRCRGCEYLPFCLPAGVPEEDVLLPLGLDAPGAIANDDESGIAEGSSRDSLTVNLDGATR
jgi:ATP-dependent exoDNAse (exonuclease V) beta subunit